MTPLQRRLRTLSADFARDLLLILATLSLRDLAEGTTAKQKTTARRKSSGRRRAKK